MAQISDYAWLLVQEMSGDFVASDNIIPLGEAKELRDELVSNGIASECIAFYSNPYSSNPLLVDEAECLDETEVEIRISGMTSYRKLLELEVDIDFDAAMLATLEAEANKPPETPVDDGDVAEFGDSEEGAECDGEGTEKTPPNTIQDLLDEDTESTATALDSNWDLQQITVHDS